MSGRRAAAIAAVVALIHVVWLVPLTGDFSFTLDKIYKPDADKVLDGQRPYDDVGYEYPPLSLPVLVAPALVTQGTNSYRRVFGAEMIAFDVALIALIAAGWRRRPRRMLEALALTTVGLWLLGQLPVERFDLVPAVLALAAVLARERGRAAGWGFWAGAGAAVKAFPILLVGAFAAGERRLGRAAAGVAAGLAIGAAIVLGLGDEFLSAIGYHTGRDLQLETLGSSVLIAAHQLGAPATVEFSSGSFNLQAPGADAARLLSAAAVLAWTIWVTWLAWRRVVEPALLAIALVSGFVILGPVLSPQFLIWLLPLAGVAFGLSAPGVTLLVATAATGVLMDGYYVETVFGADFVRPLLIRNLLLVVYLVLVAWRLLGAPARRRTTSPSRSEATRQRPLRRSVSSA